MTTIYDAAILLVDDNPDLLTLVTDNLRTAGYKSVCTAADCAAARAAFAAHRPDLMILDINLPDGDGFGLFRTLRTESDVPALFLSARDADADRLFGLGLGADDYLTKPFLMQELLLRVQHIVTYDAVCEAVWGADYYGYENSLNVHIRHLREKIEPDPGHPQWLLTVRGIGYRLTGEV
jgi:DNA-binding response OmpR family regulator